MALIEKKITSSERDAVQVKSIEGSRLAGSVSENKNVFDKFPQLIMDKFNELVDALSTLGLDDIVEDLNNRYTKPEVDSIVNGTVKKIVLNGKELEEDDDGTVNIWFTAEGGDMETYATKAYVEEGLITLEGTVNETFEAINETFEAVNENMNVLRNDVVGTVVTKMLAVDNWQEGVYSFEEEYPSANYDVSLELSSECTTEQIYAFGDALIVGNIETNSCIAKGTVPTIDIPVVLKVVKKNA